MRQSDGHPQEMAGAVAAVCDRRQGPAVSNRRSVNDPQRSAVTDRRYSSFHSGVGSPSHARRGVALIVTLTVMALLLIMAVAFVVNMRDERLASRTFSDQLKAREMALSGLHAAIGQMQSFFTMAERNNCVVATMPGMFYWSNVVSHTAGRQCMFSYQPPNERDYLSKVSSGQAASRNEAARVNLNSGNYQRGERYLPIFNPHGQPTSSLDEMNRVPIYADWLPIFRVGDSRILNYNQSASGTQMTSVGLGDAGRYAFWVDDESVKINLNNVGGATMGQTNVTFVPGKPRAPTSSIQPTDGRFDVRHVSSTDLAALDLSSVMAGRWNSATVLNEIDRARHPAPDRWVKFQTPEDILGVASSLTMQDFQAAKHCLTVWSEDQNDYSQVFRFVNPNNGAPTVGRPQERTNVSMTINSIADRDRLYYFLARRPRDPKNPGTTAQGQLRSHRLISYFGGATFDDKYEGKSGYQQPFYDPTAPLKGGHIEQIAANIVSYLSDPSVPPITIAPGNGLYYNYGNNVPRGACGLRKAAYMNEIVVAAHWQKTKDQQGTGTTAQPAEWTLWGVIYVEMINPYSDDAMPRATPTVMEKYYIIWDGTFSFSGQVQSPPQTINYVINNSQIMIDGDDKTGKLHLVPGNNYSYAVQNPTGAATTPPYSYLLGPVRKDDPGANKFEIAKQLKGEIATDPREAKPPFLGTLTVTLPKTIRQLAIPSLKVQGAQDYHFIADWYDETMLNQPTLKTLNLIQTDQPGRLEAAAIKEEPTVPEMLGEINNTRTRVQNPARVSIAKDDPRVHFWNGPVYGPQITVAFTATDPSTARNFSTTQKDSKVGDGETSSDPERYSNFVIAERGMQSVGELGFIHTGKPWRSLSLQRYGLMPDEKSAATTAVIPDWAIMDLLTVYNKPIVGRININNAGWQGEDQDLRNPAWQGADGDSRNWRDRPQPNLYYRHGGNVNYEINQWDQAGRRSAAVGRNTGPWSHTLTAALNFIRHTGVRDNLVQSIVRRIIATGPVTNPNAAGTIANPFMPYFSIGELAELRYMNQYDLSSSNPNTQATTDAQKEETLRRLCNVLTTRSDVFTVHAVGQAFGNGRLTGEARLMAVVQRIGDYDATLRAANNPGWNRFRIRHLRWVHTD